MRLFSTSPLAALGAVIACSTIGATRGERGQRRQRVSASSSSSFSPLAEVLLYMRQRRTLLSHRFNGHGGSNSINLRFLQATMDEEEDECRPNDESSFHDEHTRTTCTDCETHPLWEYISIPTGDAAPTNVNMSNINEVRAYQKDVWTITNGGGDDMPLTKIHCINGCSTCYDSHNGTDNSTTYCGFVETKWDYVVSSVTKTVLTPWTSNAGSVATATTLSATQDSFDFLASLQVEYVYTTCLTYDATAVNETGRVCLELTMPPYGGADEYSCSLFYNDVPCDSCRFSEIDTSDSCLVADCSNLFDGMMTAKIDSCSDEHANTSFVGPWRFLNNNVDAPRVGRCRNVNDIAVRDDTDNGSDSDNGGDSGSDDNGSDSSNSRVNASTIQVQHTDAAVSTSSASRRYCHRFCSNSGLQWPFLLLLLPMLLLLPN